MSVRLFATASVSAVLLGLTGCGSAEDPAPAAAPTAQTSGDSRQFPGAQGEVAAVDGKTAQVQNPMAGQVAVTWTGRTTFTQQVSASLSDVSVGDCVMVRSDDAGSSSNVAATSVRITEKTDGSCAPGGMGGPGRPEVRGTPPSDLPQPPEGADRPRQMRMGGAFGEVTAVSDGGFTVKGAMPGGDSSVTVTVGEDTTYTTDATARASDVRVGSCVVARGEADETGAITADTIAISKKENGSCGDMIMRGGPRAGQVDS